MTLAALWGFAAASSLLLGALITFALRPSRHVLGLLMGFGAGALISAIAYDLVQEAFAHIDFAELAIGLGIGAALFYGLNSLIDSRSPKRSDDLSGQSYGQFAILLGTLLDGIPESLVLGMSFAATHTVGAAFVAAVFVSNLPEAITATAELEKGGWTRLRIAMLWSTAVVASSMTAALGFFLISAVPGLTGGFFEAIAAGALLMMLSDAMIPEALTYGGKRAGFFLVLGFAFAFGLSALNGR